MVRGAVVVVVRVRMVEVVVVVAAWRCSIAGGGGIACRGAVRCATSGEMVVERAL